MTKAAQRHHRRLSSTGRKAGGNAAAVGEAAAHRPLHERLDEVSRQRQEKLLAAREVRCAGHAVLVDVVLLASLQNEDAVTSL